MKVAFHSVPEGFFETNPPYADYELISLIREAASLGFKCFQVGPLSNFAEIDGKRLKAVLDQYSMESNVHVGGLYNAQKFALTEREYRRAQKEIHYGIKLCKEINSSTVSFHRPLLAEKNLKGRVIISNARKRFFELVKKEVEFACSRGIKMALESFCYTPFVFNGLRDFMQFVSYFPSTRLGILLEVGHYTKQSLALIKLLRRSKIDF